MSGVMCSDFRCIKYCERQPHSNLALGCGGACVCVLEGGGWDVVSRLEKTQKCFYFALSVSQLTFDGPSTRHPSDI